MQETYRHERDKFQILTEKLTASIEIYLSGASPDVVIDNVHASHSILLDLNDYFCGRPSERFKKRPPPAKTIQEPQYISMKLDKLHDNKYFNRKTKNGNVGLYAELGNAVKHADHDPLATTSILHQHAFEYLYILVRDYQLLKDALVEAGIVKKQREFLNRKRDTMPAQMAGALSRHFKRAVGLYAAQPQAPEPVVDMACNVFLGWVDMINKDFNNLIGYRLKSDYQPSEIWDVEDQSNFTLRETAVIMNAMRMGIASKLLPTMIKEIIGQYGKADNGYGRVLMKELRGQIKEIMRNESKYTAFNVLNARLRQYSWRGAGYYLDIDGKEPFHSYGAVDEACFESREIASLD